ncbi:MAG TPA: hypothetical protein P5017_04915 [Anaerohalosphaeraceae bacterium]|nr:hypothetical protein [Anaerohalosphaeraceae bacterium]
MAEWEIKKPLGRCSVTGREFAVDEEYYAALVETPQGLERRDFCKEYWEANGPEVYCFWKTRMPNPQKKKQMFIDPEMLLTFFDRLADETDPEKMNFRFVLMLVLMRQKRLKYESGRMDNGREIWTVRVVGQERTVDVVNPKLTDEQIQQLSGQMSQILQVELD